MVFSSLPVILIRPHIGVLVWSWLGYMNPHRLAWGFAYNFPFSKVVGATLITAWLFSPESKRFPMTPLTVLWLLFVGWVCLTTTQAMFPEAAQEMLSRILKIQLIVFITIMLMRSRERLEQLIWVIAFSLGFFGIKGGIYKLTIGGGALYGPGGFIEDNNALAIALVMTLPLFNYLRLRAPQRALRWFLAFCIVMIAIAVIGTFSRAAALGGLAIAFMFWLKSHHKLASALALIVLLPMLYVWAPDSWHERMATIAVTDAEQRESSAQSRLYIWGMIINLAKDKPIMGAGLEPWHPETYQRYASDPDKIAKAWAAHSIYFSVLAEHGFVGLALQLLIFGLALRTASRISREMSKIPDAEWLSSLTRMLQISLIGYLVAGAFHQLPYFDLPWHIIGIIVICQGLAVDIKSKSESRQAAEAPLPAPLPGSALATSQR